MRQDKLEWLHDHVGRNVVAVQARIGGAKGMFSGCRAIPYGSIQVPKQSQIKLNHFDIENLEVVDAFGPETTVPAKLSIELAIAFQRLIPSENHDHFNNLLEGE